ncbi:MAG: hypothetical protein ABSB11_01625 [Sedimentisphaerales bacterium]|jgi:hypothetical protein
MRAKYPLTARSRQTKKKQDWYSQIEEPVRELVRLLRNNGFNTFCSCGHNKPHPCVDMEWYGFEEEARKVYCLLLENGYNNFEIRLFLPSSVMGRYMKVTLLNEH